jgi:CheY-like chemotaxis protein
MKILLADDSMTAQNMGKKILAEAGYDVVAVSNGAAAMKKIASEKPDLLVLDVYMPGYSGLEICEKVRAAAETSRLPVLLAVGKMENFQPEETARVRADGVIVKPFEASELLAAVQKLEDKAAASAASAAAAEAAAMPMPMAAPEFQGAGYEEWKVTADDHVEEEEAAAPPKFTMSEEVGAAPAFAMDEMEVTAAPAGEFPAEAASPAAPPSFGEAPEFVAEEPPAQESRELAPEVDPAVEFTSPPQEDVPVTKLPELETATSEPAPPAADDARDPALVTDASEMASAFPTSFGIEGAEEVPVGVASDVPGLYDDERAAEASAEAQPTAAQDASPLPEAPPVLESPQHYGVEHEMEVRSEAPQPAPESPAPPAAAEQGPDPELAAALSAVMSALPPQPAGEDEPPPPPPEPVAEAAPVLLDPEAVAAIVERVVARHKAALVDEIMREIEAAGRQ